MRHMRAQYQEFSGSESIKHKHPEGVFSDSSCPSTGAKSNIEMRARRMTHLWACAGGGGNTHCCMHAPSTAWGISSEGVQNDCSAALHVFIDRSVRVGCTYFTFTGSTVRVVVSNRLLECALAMHVTCTPGCAPNLHCQGVSSLKGTNRAFSPKVNKMLMTRWRLKSFRALITGSSTVET